VTDVNQEKKCNRHAKDFLRSFNNEMTTLANFHVICKNYFEFFLSNSLGSSPGWGHCIVFLGKTLDLTVPLSTQEYK